jgi:hypothetical protein
MLKGRTGTSRGNCACYVGGLGHVEDMLAIRPRPIAFVRISHFNGTALELRTPELPQTLLRPSSSNAMVADHSEDKRELLKDRKSVSYLDSDPKSW